MRHKNVLLVEYLGLGLWGPGWLWAGFSRQNGHLFELIICLETASKTPQQIDCIQRIVLATEETTMTQQVSLVLSCANPACGHKEVLRLTGHIMVTTRYSDQRGSKSRQNLCRLPSIYINNKEPHLYSNINLILL